MDKHEQDQDQILEADSLNQIYTNSSISNQSHRWTHLISSFNQQTYPKDHHPIQHPPQFISRAPGRVNIIGEHIDYCGFSVLPSAIEPDLLICGSVIYEDDEKDSSQKIIPAPIAKNTDHHQDFHSKKVQVQLFNLNPHYPPALFDYHPSTRIPIGNGEWSDYIKSALNVCLDHLKKSSDLNKVPIGIKLLIDGTVPAGSGLSSSAAITTASVITFLHIHRSGSKKLSKDLVASLAIKAERECGINVGGMDQTASVFGQRDKLLHIEFEPKTSAVPLDFPTQPSTCFIIANSLVTSKKLESSKVQYNLRVVECRIGTRILYDYLIGTKQSSSSKDDHQYKVNKYPKNLRELVEIYSTIHQSSITTTIQSILKKLDQIKTLGHIDGLDLNSILLNLGINQVQFESEILDGLVVEPRDGLFKPYRRVRHVLTESLRVYKFREILELSSKGLEKVSEEGVMKSLGELMNESQSSCQIDYECSCDQLDRLISIARANGSLGSRLTGAGWGGSTVHLVREEDKERLIESIKLNYYCSPQNLSSSSVTIGTSSNMNLTESFDDICFSTKPQGGACLFANLNHFTS